MNLEEIKSAVENNTPAYWGSRSYRIIKNNNLFIKCSIAGHTRSLTDMDSVALAEPESDSFKIGCSSFASTEKQYFEAAIKHIAFKKAIIRVLNVAFV